MGITIAIISALFMTAMQIFLKKSYKELFHHNIIESLSLSSQAGIVRSLDEFSSRKIHRRERRSGSCSKTKLAAFGCTSVECNITARIIVVIGCRYRITFLLENGSIDRLVIEIEDIAGNLCSSCNERQIRCRIISCCQIDKSIVLEDKFLVLVNSSNTFSSFSYIKSP